MKLLLEPHWIAKECFLYEALLWGGFYRYPKSEIVPDHIDIRFDRDAQEDFEPYLPNDYGYIESEEAIRVGLPPNPEYEAIFDEKIYMLSTPDTINKLLKLTIEESEKEKLKKELVESEEQAKIKTEWDKKYEAYIELVESKLFIALREGKIKAYGRKLPHHDFDTAIGILDGSEKSWTWFDMEHEEIPTTFWRISGIDWSQSSAQNGESHYFHIYVKTYEAMEVFPAPIGEEAKTVSLVAGQYILDEDEIKNIKMPTKRGRPSLDWNSFYLELTDRIKSDDLPDKQESFIAEMQDWCIKNWGQQVGRSTLLQKISPFYKKYVIK